MKYAFSLLMILGLVFVVNNAVADENDFRCLKSIGLKKPIRIQFVFQTEKDNVGYVKYENGSEPIQVKRIKEKELRKAPGGRPSEFEATWQEVTPGGAGGTYLIVSQGARINGFRYIRPDGKTFRFEEDLDAPADSGCNWSSK